PLLRSSESSIVAVGALSGIGIAIIVVLLLAMMRRRSIVPHPKPLPRKEGGASRVDFPSPRKEGKGRVRGISYLAILVVQLALLIAVFFARTPVLDAYAASLEDQLQQPGSANMSSLLHELAVINPSRAYEVTAKLNQD